MGILNENFRANIGHKHDVNTNLKTVSFSSFLNENKLKGFSVYKPKCLTIV